MFYLMDLERTIKTGRATYWKDNELGYTTDLSEAGLYEEERAQHLVDGDIRGYTISVSKSDVMFAIM